MKKILIIVFVLISSVVFSQSRKKIKEIGYTTKVEYVYEYRAGKEQKIKVEETTFNKEGRVSTLKEFDELGKIEKHVAYFYNGDGDEIKTVHYLPSGKLKKTVKYKYSRGFKIEKVVYNADDKVISKKKYIYN